MTPKANRFWFLFFAVLFVGMAFVWWNHRNFEPEIAVDPDPDTEPSTFLEVKRAPSPKSEKTFERTLELAVREIPTVAALGEETDHEYAPAVTFKAGEILGKIESEIEHHPSYASKAIPFFRECALNEEAILSARALCLGYLRRWSEKTNENFNPSEFSDQLNRLASLMIF